ncbi:MAG: efflux RND transporter periplasmic adaptor subunit [Bacteroidales bacterium]|nr:efflux RND transporter periplasmic adaptor subunit [Bacteroidales bacterium]
MYKILTGLLVVLTLFGGCKNGQDDHDHSHDDVLLFLTGYNDGLEVFAEATPFALGQNSAIYAHFTRLADFKQLEDAEVTLSLIVGREGIRQTVETPVRKGIYAFSLQPVAAGQGQVVFDVKTPSGEYRISIPNIMVYDDAHDAIYAAEELMPNDPNAIVFTKEQSWKVNFATDLPRKEAFGQVIRTAAQVLPAQGDEVLVTARTSGVVLFSAGALLPGMNVASGRPLMSVSSSGLADNNMGLRLTEARNNYEKASADLKRAEELASEQIVSERELLHARNEYENARAVFENLNRNFSQAGQTVSSPMAGIVKDLLVENGQYVEAGQPLFSVMQNRRLLLRASVPQRFARDLIALETANISIPNHEQTFTLEQLGGRILSVGRAANSDNYLIPVLLEVNQTGDLFPGGFAELFLITRSQQEAITIPREALMEEQGTYYVFVQLTPEMFAKREVAIGVTDGLRTEIRQGLVITDRVVTKGAIWVKLAESSAALDPHAGHVH